MELRIAPKDSTEHLFKDLIQQGWFHTDVTHVGVEANGDRIVLMCPGLDQGYIQVRIPSKDFFKIVDYVIEAEIQLEHPEKMDGQQWLDTGNPWQQETYVDRMERELAELDERYTKLITFIGSASYVKLPDLEAFDLKEQAQAMKRYKSILNGRLQRAKDKDNG